MDKKKKFKRHELIKIGDKYYVKANEVYSEAKFNEDEFLDVPQTSRGSFYGLIEVPANEIED